jgi:hypothetical protein
VCWDNTERCVGTIQRGCVGTIQSGVLGPYREGEVSTLNGVQREELNVQII